MGLVFLISSFFIDKNSKGGKTVHERKVPTKVQRANLTCDVIRKVAPFVITKNTKNTDFKKTVPPVAPYLLALWPPWGSKNFLGGFWHLSQLKFEEISPKTPRMQIL